MPGPLDQNTDEGVGATLPSLSGPVDRTGFFANVQAGYQSAQAGPGSTRSRQNAHEAKIYDQMITALTAEGEMGADKIEVRPNSWGYTGPKDIPVNRYGVGLMPKARPFRNPYTDKPSLSQKDNPLARLYLEGDNEEKGAIWEAIKRVRSRPGKEGFLKDIPDEAALAALAEKSRNARRATADAVLSRAGKAGTVGGFVGAVAGSIVAGDPENFVGGGVAAAGKVTARQVVKRAVQEGAANAVSGAVALPTLSADMERLGDGPMTGQQALRSIGEQAVVGAVLGGGMAVAPGAARKVGQAAGAIGTAVVDAASKVAPDAVMAASLRAGTVKDRSLLTEYRRLHSPYAVSDTSTPTERAAINVVERDIEVREASPLPNDADAHNEGRLDAIAASLGVQIKPPPLPTTTPVQVPTVLDNGQRRATSYDDGLHKAEGTGKNPDSSANGHFQFIEKTWLSYAPRVADTAGMSRSQILNLRHDRGIATKAERLFRADNARFLRDRGQEDSAGNLSLAHFLGNSDAVKVLKADPNTPISQLVDPDSLRANKSVFGKNDTAGKMVAWAHRRIGASVDHVPARSDAVPAFDTANEMDYASVRPYESLMLRPDEVETDAALMQYKSGGDDAGVTDKLRGVTAWNPMLSSEIMVWEGLDGRRVVVDGHQRTGLAKRLYADDPSIQLPAIVIREADGITSQQARTLGALRNINLGTGSLIDNARVLRDAPNGSAMLQGAENRRSIEGLARLNHEAFGAAVNDVIDPAVAAQIGLNAGDSPDTHMAMVDLLLKNRIRNPAEAGSIIRQARADGFGSPEAEQLGMFGDAPTSSLYVPIARILAAAEKRLREEKRTFKTLGERAGAIEGAGNVLDRGANQDRVVGASEAQAILRAVAHRSGPVRDALIAAARAELSGAKRGDAVAGFLDALGETDLRAAASGVGRDGRAGEPFGSEGGGDAAASPDGDIPDSLEPSLFDQAVDVAAKAEAFSDPVGPGARDQTDLLAHDLRMDAVDQIVYHGTASQFDRFSLDHMGTGEGNQTYGWGLYFAGQRDVADFYRDKLADNSVKIDGETITNNGKPLAETSPIERAAVFAAASLRAGESLTSKARMVRNMIRTAETSPNELTSFQREGGWGDAETLKEAAAILDDWATKDVQPGGNTFEVRIPAEGNYIVWDSPAAKQPQALASALARAGTNIQEIADIIYDDGDAAKLSGEQIYRKLADIMGSDEAASRALAESGVAGIKYHDGASRGRTDGSFNYVLFNAESASIVPPLFGLPETGFRLDEDTAARPIAEIMAEAEADEAAAINAKACLK